MPAPNSAAANAGFHRPGDSLRLVLAGLIPLAACGLQLLFWEVIQPYVWFLFFPAVFFSSWVGGRRGGLLATGLSTVLVLYFFIPPRFSFAVESPFALISVTMFVFMGILFSFFHERLRQANRLAADAQFRELFEQAAVGLAQVGLDGSFLRVNQRLCDIVGYPRGELLAKTIQDITHPDDLAGGVALVRQLLAGERQTYTLEKRYLRKDQSVVPINLTVSLVRDRAGQPEHFILVLEDITVRKRAEVATAQLAAIVQSSDDAVIGKTLDGLITSWNPGAERVFGFSADEMIGHSITMLIPLERQDDEEKIMSRIKRGESVQHFETVRVRKDGCLIDVSVTVSPIKDADGKIVGVSKVARDITEQKRAAEKLRQSEAALREGQRLAKLGNWEWNTATDRHTWSPEIYRIYGRNPELAPAGVPEVSKYFTPESWAGLSAAVEQGLKHNLAYEYDAEVVRPDGAHRWVTARGEALHDASGKMTGLRGTVQDITERKQADEKMRRTIAELERSNQELEHFAYVASHDLQEPLRMVSSYTQLLAQHYEGQLDEKARKYIHYAVDGAVRMQTLINDLLTYSRVGRHGKPLQPTDAHAVLGEAIRNLATAIAETQAIISNDDLPKVQADTSQLVQLFQNLLANALKFQGGSRPRIHVSARADGDRWRFAVRDNGIGIEAQYAERVFILFQRLHTREEYSGTGIGLAVCKRIVERHGGKIWFESEPGKGTTFFFTLPAIQTRSPSPVQPAL